MKKSFLSALVLGALLLTSCNETQPAEESTAAQTETKVFGQDFEVGETLSVTQLQDAVAQQDSVEATITGEIVESCQSKGCRMDLRLADNSVIKVTFRDYGFFLPVEDLSGKSVMINGTAKREVISVEDQRHYAEDAGKPTEEIQAITEPREELRFEADGVKFL